MRDHVPHSATIVELPVDHPMSRQVERLARAADQAAKAERIGRHVEAIARHLSADLVPVDPSILPPGELARMRERYDAMVAAAPPPPDPATLAELRSQHDAAMAYAKASPIFDHLTRARAL